MGSRQVSAVARHQINVHALTDELTDAMDRLESDTERYAELVEASAGAEAAFKRVYHIRQVELADADAGRRKSERRTVQERESLAMQASATEHGVYLLREAAMIAAREGLRTARTRVEAIRTLMSTERSLLS